MLVASAFFAAKQGECPSFPQKEKGELNLQREDCRPPRKRQPGGLTILHDDRDILVVVKPAGLLTVGTDRDKARTAHYLLNDYVRKGDPKSRNRVYVVHRLDQDTSGIMLFTKSEPAKQFLQEHWEQTEKHYLAVIHGRLTPREGMISTWLVENAAQRVYSTTDVAKGKLAHTAYQVLQEVRGFSLVDIHLLTGAQTPDLACISRNAAIRSPGTKNMATVAMFPNDWPCTPAQLPSSIPTANSRWPSIPGCRRILSG